MFPQTIKVQAKTEDVKKVLRTEDYRDIYDGNEILTITGAKAYWRGGGWWVFSGYAWDGRDTKELLYRL